MPEQVEDVDPPSNPRKRRLSYETSSRDRKRSRGLHAVPRPQAVSDPFPLLCNNSDLIDDILPDDWWQMVFGVSSTTASSACGEDSSCGSSDLLECVLSRSTFAESQAERKSHLRWLSTSCEIYSPVISESSLPVVQQLEISDTDLQKMTSVGFDMSTLFPVDDPLVDDLWRERDASSSFRSIPPDCYQSNEYTVQNVVASDAPTYDPIALPSTPHNVPPPTTPDHRSSDVDLLASLLLPDVNNLQAQSLEPLDIGDLSGTCDDWTNCFRFEPIF